MSYNVLLPSSTDGWWTYKNYCPSTLPSQTQWPYRQELLKTTMFNHSPSIICVQEASEKSIQNNVADFYFLSPAYSSVVIKAGRMRVITFYKSSELEIFSNGHDDPSQYSKDRTVVVPFIHKLTKKRVWVVNCHLSAGPNGDRRLRQLSDALDFVKKKAKALGLDTNNIIVAGDFNSDDNEFPLGETSALTALLRNGETGKNFTELAEIVTKKGKKQGFGTFVDAYSMAYGGNPPPTLVCPQLIPSLCGKKDAPEGVLGSTSSKIVPTRALVKMIGSIFDAYRRDAVGMDKAAVEEFLVDINHVLGRGSEFRSAMEFFDASSATKPKMLSCDDLLNVYVRELEGSKFWGVAFDIYSISKVSERNTAIEP